MKKQIIYVRDARLRPFRRPVGAPMPTWYDKGDESLKAQREAWKEEAELERRKAERRKR